jgi:hypothetical protein
MTISYLSINSTYDMGSSSVVIFIDLKSGDGIKVKSQFSGFFARF